MRGDAGLGGTADPKAAKGAKGAPDAEEVAPEEKQIMRLKSELQALTNLVSGMLATRIPGVDKNLSGPCLLLLSRCWPAPSSSPS